GSSLTFTISTASSRLLLLLRLPVHRQPEPEDAALPYGCLLVYAYGSAVERYYLLDYRESQPGAGSLLLREASLLELVEPLEELDPVLRAYAYPCVAHLYPHALPLPRGLYAYAAFVGEFVGV